MKYDPFTLRVALDKAGAAHGELYLDDGVSYSHQNGEFVWRRFVAEKQPKKGLRLTSKDLAQEHPSKAVDGVALKSFDSNNAFAKDIGQVRVEKIVIVGMNNKPSSVKVDGGDELVWEYTPGVAASDKKEGVPSILSIKDPRVLIAKNWSILVQ